MNLQVIEFDFLQKRVGAKTGFGDFLKFVNIAVEPDRNA